MTAEAHWTEEGCAPIQTTVLCAVQDPHTGADVLDGVFSAVVRDVGRGGGTVGHASV